MKASAFFSILFKVLSSLLPPKLLVLLEVIDVSLIIFR